ncbi:lysis protein, partial [Salmonella enterica subsp. enterica serovar Java]|nr:lysis protein [Salmonella enterica subsp. enterica serovar Java]EBV8393206.1 lysis protein [Salmonella enterica subsp. enterica serovar Virchow]EBX2067850.1 lysis protein [Salmonella enterica subsp. enterica serovar Java]EBX5401267.1 lysis protein [Salmonella enterica subsp. enterica serovar Java]EBY8645500.1 lysis protein [Salmonella enterica subsp. enterica serovar Java]
TTPASTGSVGDAATVELSPDSGQNVLSIRSGIINDQAKLRYLQQYVMEQCQ